MVCLRRFEKEVAFMKVEQALAAHFSKLQRQPAALYAKVIRKLLAASSSSEMPEKSAAVWSTGKNSFIKSPLSLKIQPTCCF